MAFAYVKGSPEAFAQQEKMRAGQQAARRKAEEAARAALGPQAPQGQIDAYVREARRAQRQAKAAGREMGRQQKIAETNLRAAAATAFPGAPPPVQPTFTSSPPPPPSLPPIYEPPLTQGHDDLYNHPIFGTVAQPEGVASVSVYRLPSDLPEHRGVTPGYLQSMSFDEFSEDTIRVNHGGGKFRAVAKDARGRVIRSGDFTIAGRAKLYTPTEEELQGTNGGRGQSRVASVFRTEQGEEMPTGYRLYIEQQDKRMERLEALIEAQLAGAHKAPTDEDKLSRWKQELEAKDEQEQKRHDRRLAEIKAEMEANTAKETARLNAAQMAATAASAQQMEFMKAIVQSQSGVNTTLMTALVSKKDDGGGGTEKFLLPMIEGMGAMMKAQNGNYNQLFAILKDSMGGEDNRTTGTRVLDMIEKGVSGLWEKAGDGLLMNIVSQLGKPKENAVPQAIPAGSAFQLPDGRVVPPEVCAQFLARYRQLHGVNPSMEVCVAAFVEIMNQQQAQPGQPAQIAGAAAPQQQFTQQITQEQAEEFVRQAQQKAAEEATRAGKTAEEVQFVAKAAAQQAVLYLRSLIAGQQQQAQPAAPAAAVPAQAAATVAPQAAPSPAPAAVAAAAQAAQTPLPPPQPAPAAVAAQAAAAPAQAGPIPPMQTATAVVQAGPIVPPGSVTVPWMHRGFLQFAIDAFQARQNPIDFLFLAVQQGKISVGAKLEVGRMYEDAGDDEELKAILTKVAGVLVQKGVVMPGEFLSTFGGAPEGESWLETFLFACSCSTREEALKRLKDEE